VGVLGGLAGYAFALEPKQLRLERVTVPVPELAGHLDGYTIGVLSDLHLGSLVSVAWVRNAAERLAALHPDLVLIAGDMTGYVETYQSGQQLIDEALEPVRGAYGVLGNWDRLVPEIIRPQNAVRMLINAGVTVAPDLWLSGLDDGLWGSPSIDRALAKAPVGGTRILLAHEPDLADLVRPEHQVALQISGHSHGGQIRLPLVGPLLLPPLGRKYPAGLNQAPGCQVYTSRGVGVTQVPARFLCPPEITLITLKRRVA
jgi:hypothetical protein